MVTGHLEGNWHVLVSDLELRTSPMVIVPGLTLKRLESPLTVFDLAAAGAVGFRAWALIEPFAPFCRSEIISSSDAATPPGYDALNRIWLASSMLYLLGHSRHLSLACSRYSWNRIAGFTKKRAASSRGETDIDRLLPAENEVDLSLPDFHGDILDYHINIFLPADNRDQGVNTSDLAWVGDNYEKFNHLAAEDKRFSFALEASINWRYAHDKRSAIAGIWAGIEAIFGVNSELVYRISSYVASLLVPRGERRTEMFRQVKRLYGKRSKAVHGDILKDEELSIAMNESFSILRKLIIHMVEVGRSPSKQDLDQALFS